MNRSNLKHSITTLACIILLLLCAKRTNPFINNDVQLLQNSLILQSPLTVTTGDSAKQALCTYNKFEEKHNGHILNVRQITLPLEHENVQIFVYQKQKISIFSGIENNIYMSIHSSSKDLSYYIQQEFIYLLNRNYCLFAKTDMVIGPSYVVYLIKIELDKSLDELWPEIFDKVKTFYQEADKAIAGDSGPINNPKYLAGAKRIIHDPKEFLDLLGRTQKALVSHLNLYRRLNLRNPNTPKIPKIYVVGDLHGNINNFLSILLGRDSHGKIRLDEIKNNNAHLVLLGDIIDPAWDCERSYYRDKRKFFQGNENNRFDHQLYLIVCVLDLICKYPDRVHYFRGNHEDNYIEGIEVLKNHISYNTAEFRSMLQVKYPGNSANEIFSSLMSTWSYSPVIMRVETPAKTFFLTHSGALDLKNLPHLQKVKTWSRRGILLGTKSDQYNTLLYFLSGRSYAKNTIEKILFTFSADILIAGHSRPGLFLSRDYAKFSQHTDAQTYAMGKSFLILHADEKNAYSVLELDCTENQAHVLAVKNYKKQGFLPLDANLRVIKRLSPENKTKFQHLLRRSA